MRFLVVLLVCMGIVLADQKQQSENWLSEAKLDPYKVNYVLPLSYTSHTYRSYFPDTKYEHIEVEIQIKLIKLNN